jgi:hypothetical protein
MIIGLTSAEEHRAKLFALGFSEHLVPGERLLPPRLGPISRYNAVGKEIVHRDRPKEKLTRQIVWEWEQWRGRDTERRSKIVDVPYERYPRTQVPPPSIELALARDSDGELIVVTEPVVYRDQEAAEILHRINLMRELFAEAAVLTEDLEHFVIPAFQRLNWEVLPPGEMPWDQLQKRLEPVLKEKFGERERPVVEYRLQVLTEKHSPGLTAVGRAGFDGYLIFGYPEKNRFVLENLDYGNATYVFGQNWEKLSQLTKREIIADDLQLARVIHREGWADEISEILA